MRVIGVGLGRTGTLSLKVALERLGYGPCYHMQEVFERPDDIALWLAAGRGEPVEWERALGPYQATTDWPACTYWRALVAAYPAAKVILTTRDPERWYDSVRDTIFQVFSRLGAADRLPPPLALYRAMIETVIWHGTFGGRFEDREHSIEVFRRHGDDVVRAIPPERLLVYQVGEGWEPLCAFLDVPVPDEPFPHLNDAASFHARVADNGGPGALLDADRRAPDPG